MFKWLINGFKKIFGIKPDEQTWREEPVDSEGKITQLQKYAIDNPPQKNRMGPSGEVPWEIKPHDVINYPSVNKPRKIVNNVEVPLSNLYDCDNVMRFIGVLGECGYRVNVDINERMLYYNKPGEDTSSIAFDRIGK